LHRFRLLVVTADPLQANIGSKSAISLQRGPVDSMFHVKGVAPPPSILFRKLGGMIFRMV